MKRYSITATLCMEVEVDDDTDESDAWSEVCDLFDRAPVRDFMCHTWESEPIAYKGLPPHGADLWARAAARAWLVHDDRELRPPLGVVFDGSWWWTNGHVMLRCEGELPDGFRRVPDDDAAKAFALKRRRKKTLWSATKTDKLDSLVGRRAFAAPDVAIQEKYKRLVEESLETFTWLVGKDISVPIHALDESGRLMAVVAPMRAEGLDPIELPQEAAQ